jgi:hypothetical protein
MQRGNPELSKTNQRFRPPKVLAIGPPDCPRQQTIAIEFIAEFY